MVLILGATAGTPARASDTVVIGGTGMGLALAEKITELVASEGAEFNYEVLQSIGSSGGLRALGDGAVDLAISGRRLKQNEEAAHLTDRACLVTPLLFASERSTPGGISTENLPAIYSDASRTWQDGTPLKVILRARSGSEMPYLASKVPGLKEAFEDAYTRPGIAIGVTDQVNAEMATIIEGSFAIVTLLQIKSEKLRLNALTLDGVEPSAQAAANGTYPFPIKVCFVSGPNEDPGVTAFLDSLRYEQGREIVRELGAVLVY